MAGRGPAPKDPARRARTNKEPVATTVIEFEPAPQPDLPEVTPEGEPWPGQTRTWWSMWGNSPLSAQFGSTDWSELLDTAVLHARLWAGDKSVAGEIRLRVAKHGATAEDRARLRIQFAHADEAESKRPVLPARERRPVLRALPETG